MRQRIIPNIWCTGNAEEVAEFYSNAFDDASYTIEARYATEGLPEFQQPLAGQPLSVSVLIDGYRLMLINAGDEFRPNPSISFMLNFDPLRFGGSEDAARMAQEQLWTKLADGGKALMPLGEYPFSRNYGWIEDRFGVSWQLILTDPEGEPRPFVIPALMFDGPAQDRAAEAADTYTALFADSPGGSEIGKRQAYGQPSGKASAEALAFGEFRLGEQWFVANDNGSGVDHGFTNGVSLEVLCPDQEEIDRVADALSTDPESEICGWLVDRFGVSWQVTPENMGELLAHPGAMDRMMQMKRIIIADL